MRTSTTKSVVLGIAAGVLGVTSAYGQFGFGGGGANWNTAGLNAQRTSWVATDKYISREALADGDFQLQWKLKVEGAQRPGSIIGATSSGGGLSKPLNVIATSSNTFATVDNDTGIQGWVKHFNAPISSGSAACPAGMSANAGRPVALVPPAAAPARANFTPPAAVGYRSILGEPGQGLPDSVILRNFRPATPPPAAAAGAAPAPGLAPAPPAAPAGGFGRGGGTPPSYQTYFPNGRFGSNSGFFVLTSDGMLRTVADGNGVEVKAPVQFLPANAHASDLTVIPENNSTWHAYVVYTSTSNNCGGVPNRVWALDLASDAKTITHFDTGASPAGDLAFTEQGTVLVALGKGAANATYSNSVVALEPKTLTPKAWFTDASADFASTPTVIKAGAREIVAEVARDGRIFLLDGAQPGGSDHKTALFVSPAYSTGKGGFVPGGLASWEDAGVTYVALPFAGSAPSGAAENGKVTNGGIVTLKLSDVEGKVSLTPVWASADMTSPLVPVVVNGVMFAASSGQKSEPAVLYALDPASGKQIWSSGKALTSSIAGTPLWAQGSQVYVATGDGYVYAFGPSQGRYVVAKR